MKMKYMETRGTATAWIVGWLSAVFSQLTSLTLSEWSAVIAIISTLLALFHRGNSLQACW